VGEFVRSHPLLFGTPTESSPISSSDIFRVDEFFDLPLFRPHAAPRVGLVEEDRSNGGEGPAAWVSVRVASGIVGAGRGHVSVGQALGNRPDAHAVQVHLEDLPHDWRGVFIGN
jgi:hypothetical protein